MEWHRTKIIFILWFIILGSVFQIIRGQDAHYWSNQYGTRAQLLGGVVVGSLSGLSATFYNPGALALPTHSNLVLTTEAIEFTAINHKDGAGAGINLGLLRSAVAPSIFAIRFKLPLLGGSQFAFSYLTRYDADYNVDARRIDSADKVAQTGRGFSGEVSSTQNFVEPWVGLTWADTLVSRIGLGITQYVAVRSHRGRQQIIAQTLTNANEGASANQFAEFRYYNIRLLWKLGLSFNLRPLTFGFTVTTPGVDIYGQGSNLVNVYVSNLDINGDGIPDNELASNYQKNLPAQLKSPLSIALGASYRVGSTTLHFSAEWFDAVDQYAVMVPEAFRAQSNGEIITLRVNHSLRSVTNFGLGIEHTINEKLAFYGGFISDFSALDKTAESDITLATWDIGHLTAGAVFKVRSIDFTLGFGYGFGSDEVNPLADFTTIDQPIEIFESSALSEITFRRWRIILGFSVPF